MVMVPVLSGRRLDAAATSMSQFYPKVRTLFRCAVDDATVEAITLFLYLGVGREVFGRRVADRLAERAHGHLKYQTPEEAMVRVTQIAALVGAFDQAPDPLLGEGAPETVYEHHVRSIIRSLLVSAGQSTDDPDLIRDTFAPLEQEMEGLRAHLRGIKRQHYVLFKS
jgi:hypothetical protein